MLLCNAAWDVPRELKAWSWRQMKNYPWNFLLQLVNFDKDTHSMYSLISRY